MSTSSSSSSLLSPSRWRYDVFPSFSGEDVLQNFLSHLVNEFNRKGINSFLDDQNSRSESTGPELLEALRASRIGVVILTKNYASSSWCLDELLEIIEREEAKIAKVMTIFYDIDPADVRNQSGVFGEGFKRSCEGKTKERKQSWREALTYVASIAGEHSDTWDSEAAMILKITTDITNMLNSMPAVPPSIESLTKFPRVSHTVSKLHLDMTEIKEVPPWISDFYGLEELSMTYCSELREISPNICELGRLRLLHFSGCYNVREFPAEIFQSFCIWHELELELINIGVNSLPTYTPEETDDFPLKLYLSENDFVSIPDSVVQQVQSLYLRDCRELVSLPELPESLSELYADSCVSLERLSQSSRSSHDPKLILSLINCVKLDQEARKLVIEQWACGYAVLPGSAVPDYFTHQARGSSLTIHLNQGNLYGSLRFKACVVLPPRDELSDVTFNCFQISCDVRGRHSTTVYKWPRIYVDESNGKRLLENHLFILNSYFTLEEENIPESDMVFDFRCLGDKLYSDTIFSNILGCGVQLLLPCSCEYDSEAHPKLSTLPLKEEDEGTNSSIAETRRSNKRERSSVAREDKQESENWQLKKIG